MSPLDPNAKPESLVATETALSPIEIQNRNGIKRFTMPGLTPGRKVALIVMEMDGEPTDPVFSREELDAIDAWMTEHVHMKKMKIPFASVLPDFGPAWNLDLHLTAHVRAEQAPVLVEEELPPAPVSE